MLKRLSKVFCVLLFSFMLLGVVRAQDSSSADLLADHIKIVSTQINLLNTRLAQAKNQLNRLQSKADSQISYDQINTQLLKQINLDIAVAKSNSDSVNIELTESQQIIARIEKHIQDLENQINILNIFGIKVMRSSVAENVKELQVELSYQKKLLSLEKERYEDLQKLQNIHANIMDYNKAKYRRVELQLKSQTIVRLKEEQEKTEINFQEQQTYWLQKLNTTTLELNKLESKKGADKSVISELENEIFLSNEHVNYIYLQILITRYQDQIHQYKVAIAKSTSITLLNKINDQSDLLGKQLSRVNDLLDARIDILEKRKLFLNQQRAAGQNLQSEIASLDILEDQYKSSSSAVSELNKQFMEFRNAMHNALQAQLSSRQGIPDWNTKSWLDMGEQILWIPTLTYHVIHSLSNTLWNVFHEMTLKGGLFLIILEALWFSLFYSIRRYLNLHLVGVSDHEYGHINLKWLGMNLLNRNLIDVAIISNIFGLLLLSRVPQESYVIFLGLGLVWLLFKGILTAGRLILVESVHDAAAAVDMAMYKRMRWVLYVGGVVTALSVFISQLPIIYEVKDLFDRIFLFYVFIVSIFLLRSWRVVPSLILPYIDDGKIYLKRIVRLLGLLIPIILLTNSAIGLIGYVNLVITIAWYEGIFLLVLVGYLIVRGFFIELMERASYLVIRYVTNGWLWTEAFLKPIDKVIRIFFFLSAWALLFLIYGWDAKSPVVERLTKLLNHPIAGVLNTTITPLNIIEVLAIISMLVWAAKWTREFVYRFLMSRTKDMGLRNSIAILSQYLTVVIGFLICLRVLGIDLHALVVVAGAFFFAVGLGLRDLFNNFACGFLLLIERPLKVGDTVTINGMEGDVIHIGSRAVTIRTWDHMELLVPNTDIFNKTFINWTARDNIVRTVFPVKVSRVDNPATIQSLIHEVLLAHKDVLKEPVPEVFIKEMADDIEFEVRYYVNIRNIHSRVGVKSEVLVEVWEIFERNNIQPPYPHHEVILLGQK